MKFLIIILLLCNYYSHKQFSQCIFCLLFLQKTILDSCDFFVTAKVIRSDFSPTSLMHFFVAEHLLRASREFTHQGLVSIRRSYAQTIQRPDDFRYVEEKER